jgi:pimeloyl-ACP methyl ester carboxylesterase
MPLISVARALAALLSLLVLAGAAWLLWTWYDGIVLRDAVGALYREREPWRLWTGLGLLAWSLLGRLALLPMLARRNGAPTSARHGEGETIKTPAGSRLYVEREGGPDAPLVIFTHGWGMDSTFWRYARQDLANRFRVVVWDLPGLGKSRPTRPSDISLETFARDLATLIDLNARRSAVLVGHSIGGMTIQTLLRDNPQIHRRLAGVVLLNTTYTNPLRTMVFSRLFLALQKPVLEPAMKLVIALQPLVWLSKWQSYLSGSSHAAHRLGFGRSVTRSQLEHVTLLSTRNPPAAEARGNLAMLHWDATDALVNSPIPALVIGGDLDIVTKLEASQAIAGSTPQATLRVIGGANHLGPMERAGLYNDLIAEFVLRVQPPTSMDASSREPSAHVNHSPVDAAAPSSLRH